MLLPLTTSAVSFSIEMSVPIDDLDLDPNIFRSVIEHVFMPPKLPQAWQDFKAARELNVAMCDTLIEAARNFLQDLPYSQRPQWGHMIKMMELVRRAAKFPLETAAVQRTLSNMTAGGASVHTVILTSGF
jgi:hypothetical protein